MTIHPRCLVVLEVLASAPGPVARWDLVDRLCRRSEDDGVLRTYVSRLRAALGADSIITVRGVGYQLTDKGRAASVMLLSI